MKPTAKQLIDSVVWSLDERVTPLVDDEWGGSTLRSLRCLLQHLSVRVEIEGLVLFDDNADLAVASVEIAAVLSVATGLIAGRRDALVEVGTRVWRDPNAYPTVSSLTEENDAGREALDQLLRTLDAGEDGVEPEARAQALELADAYLRRRLERDQPMFAPAFMSSTF